MSDQIIEIDEDGHVHPPDAKNPYGTRMPDMTPEMERLLEAGAKASWEEKRRIRKLMGQNRASWEETTDPQREGERQEVEPLVRAVLPLALTQFAAGMVRVAGNGGIIEATALDRLGVLWLAEILGGKRAD